MCEQRLHAWGEPFDFRCPVREQRGGRNEQVRFLDATILTTLDEYQRQHLHRFAESHVVGQTSAEAECGQKAQPAHAHLLVWTQRRFQRFSGFNLRERIGMTKTFERLGEPRPGTDARPIGRDCFVGCVTGDVRCRQHTHCFREAQAIRRRCPLGCLKLFDHMGELLSIELNPSSANEVKSVGAREKFGDFLAAQPLAIQRDFHAEIEQSVRPDPGRRLAPYRCVYLRTRRTVHPPRTRHTHDDSGHFEHRQIGQELEGFLRCPT